MEPFLGQIQAFGFNFNPRGWAMCAGQMMSISQNTALFSLLGTTYGGNGQTTFGLPDLRGRSIVGMGQGPGLSNIVQGEVGGTESVSLTITQMPLHNHPLAGTATATATLQASSDAGDKGSPDGRMLGAQTGMYKTPPATIVAMYNEAITVTVAGTTGQAGGSQPFPIRNPFLGINVCIATQGIFPARN